MKRKFFGIAGILLVMLVFAGCNLQTNQPTTVPKTPTANQNVTGVFAGVKVASAGGNSSINVQTAGGTQSYSISPNTTLTLGGQACTLNDLAAIQAGNTSYNCTVVFNDQMGVFGVYVTGGTAK
ncbi:MAG: hypothetical protein Q7R50_03125 [Dehalococcoidales bacterium]|nr:hypothetical protein [Dehalococcoidales bacterium]